MLQLTVTLILFLILVLPAGTYLYHIATYEKTFADPVFDRVDRFIFKVCRFDKKGMNWKEYALHLLLANAVMGFAGYLILRVQGSLGGNPNGIGGMNPSLAFNTVISFMTNTNLQHYTGESGLSYLSQTAVILFMMFTSAASGYAVCMAFIRGLAGRTKDFGNFYEDMIRIVTRVLVPGALIIAVLLISQGVPQNFLGNQTVHTIEGKLQDLAMGPVAALESIKHLGTNGGGFFGANSSAPFENPTVLSNLIELYSMMLLPGACVVAFGRMVSERRQPQGRQNSPDGQKGGSAGHSRIFFGSQGRTIFAAMSILFLIGLTVCYLSEKAGNPVLQSAGLSQAMGNMEGKELRFGIPQSALFTTVTSSFTTGAVNNMHDSLTPLGGLVPLLHMMLNCVFGGAGAGLMNLIMYVILAVFLCGLMIGRTPEYLGKKIEGKEMKLVSIVLILHPLLILGFSALALETKAGLSAITNPGFHGLTQVLYEYASSAANNGSAFEGLRTDSLFWNITTGFAMFFGRYLTLIAQLAVAGSLFAKRRVNETAGTLKTTNVMFVLILVIVVYIFAALTFFPALALGPVAEQLTLRP